MQRRKFITALGAAALVKPLSAPVQTLARQTQKNQIKPRALKPGDTIGVIAPGSAVNSPDDYLLAEELADYLGVNLRYANNVKKGSGYKTRTIEERTDDIHQMFGDKNIAGVFCLRGGYGSGQLLDKIAYGIIKKNPKVFLGYSDITALHLAINKMTGLVTFHGPVMLSPFSELTAESLKKAIFSNKAIGRIENSVEKNPVRVQHHVRTIRPGKAKGMLTGGNLSLITSLMGTRYEFNTRDKILFIEDVGEPPYRIDRMLTQLKTAGKLQKAAGIVFGKCEDCSPGSSASTWDLSLGEVLDNILGDLKIPVFYGLTFGHTIDQFTLPEGVEAEIDADSHTLNITENACI